MSQEGLNASFGPQLRAIRQSMGLSQEQLASRLGFSTRYVAGLERSERNLSLNAIDELAQNLGVTPTLILDSDTSDAKDLRK